MYAATAPRPSRSPHRFASSRPRCAATAASARLASARRFSRLQPAPPTAPRAVHLRGPVATRRGSRHRQHAT